MTSEPAYNRDHRLEPTTGFDYDSLDARSQDFETRREVRLIVCEKICQLLGEIAAHDRPGLTVDSLLIAFGMSEASETELSHKHGVTKQALSKRAVEITKALGVLPGRAMKSQQARKTYAEHTREYHHREAREKERRRRRILGRIVKAIRTARRIVSQGKKPLPG